jgi:AraC-like DNA-binding protein
MTLVVRPRSLRLRPFVAALGYYESALPPGRERALPTGTTSLLVNLAEDELRTYDGPGPDARVHRTRGSALDGPSSRPRVIDTMEQRCIVSVSFTLGGAWPFTGAAPARTADQLVELADLWGRDGAVLRERLLDSATPAARLSALEDALLAHLSDTAEACPDIGYAAALIEQSTRLADVADRLGWSTGTLTRRFRERVGLTPKRFARVRRVQRVLESVNDTAKADWAAVAVTHGYFDQAHLVNEFRELAGITPTAYRPRSAAEQNHVPLA